VEKLNTLPDSIYILGEDGVPRKPTCDEEYRRWSSTFDARRVALDSYGHLVISTVFLTIDHGYDGASLWFETMVFHHGDEVYCDRYETIEEAQEGHRNALSLYAVGSDTTAQFLMDIIAVRA